VIRRDVLLECGGFDESLPACEDYDLWLRLCARYPVLFVDRPMATRYGGHADQLSARYWGMDRFRVRALEKMRESPDLSVEDRRRTLRALVSKLNVLVTGARKRGNKAVMHAYEPRLRRYDRLLAAAGTGEAAG
jgi:GT2 family glycosyltransferase